MQINYGHTVQYIANITAYETGIFDWEGLVPKTSTFDDLDKLKIERRVESDGSTGRYEMYILPGRYDVILERLGFMAEVITQITVNEGDIIDLGNRVLAEGDVSRDGIVSALDIAEVTDRMDSIKDDGVYEERADFGQKGFISALDIVSITDNMDKLINIEKYM